MIALAELARRLGAEVVGDPQRRIRGVATLEDAGPEDLSFLTSARYRDAARRTGAGAVLAPRGTSLPEHDLLLVDDASSALVEVLELFHPTRAPRPGISADARLGAGVQVGRDVEVGAFAVVGDGVELGDACAVGAGAVIGEGCSIGAGTVIGPRVVLYPATRVGARCLLHAGCVLGADGFGFLSTPDGHRKIPQVGRVVVEDDVEIGANATVDRGAVGDTLVGRGTKIDDLVMIAHGVRIGAHGLFAAQSGVAGSSRLGERVTFAGQSGAAGHLRIGDGAVVAAKSAVFDDVPAGAFVAGIPAVDHRAWKRAQAWARRVPEIRAALRALESRIEALERAEGGSTP